MKCQYCGRGRKSIIQPVPGISNIEYDCGSLLISPDEGTGLNPHWHRSEVCKSTQASLVSVDVLEEMRKTLALVQAQVDELRATVKSMG